LHIFVEIGDVMYLRGVGVHLGPCLTHTKVEKKALNKVCQLYTKYPSIKPFFYYIDAYWASKVAMWCIGVKNIWYASNDINAIIKAYH
jgi:hypothetical protein